MRWVRCKKWLKLEEKKKEKEGKKEGRRLDGANKTGVHVGKGRKLRLRVRFWCREGAGYYYPVVQFYSKKAPVGSCNFAASSCR